MPKPRHPSKIQPLSFPVFGLNWWSNPATGDTVISYCGGGGSAKTGVSNKIVIRINNNAPVDINTGDDVCVQVMVWQDYETNEIILFGAIGSSVKRFSLVSGLLTADVHVKDSGGTNVVAINALGTRMGVGCESGDVHVFDIDKSTNTFTPLHVLQGHEKAVCSLSFALRAPLLLSSAKDGTARVWYNDSLVDTMVCDVTDTKAPTTQKKVPQVLVRGTAFGDLEGKLIYTVASGRRGKAYLSKWISNGSSYQCEIRTEIHPCPVSAMNLSCDGRMALGGVDGTIVLFDVMTWKPIRKWMEVHELPVTCIAARPYPTPCQGEEDGVMYHAISASADSQLALLTLMTRGPKKEAARSSNDNGSMPWFTLLFWGSILLSILHAIAKEALTICSMDMSIACIMHEVLVAPPSRPGILVPPY